MVSFMRKALATVARIAPLNLCAADKLSALLEATVHGK